MRFPWRNLVLFSLALSLVAVLPQASMAAGVTGLFSTGVDGAGNPWADDHIGDPHYSLIYVPGGSSTIRVRDSIGGYPIPPWLADDTRSAWIGPDNDHFLDGDIGSVGVPSSYYIYRTTFTVSGSPTLASITGQWATDDLGIDVLINGVSTGNTSGGFSVWSPLSVTSGFVSGTNTLDFLVANTGGGPTGMRAEFGSVPEPSSLLLFAVGLAALVSMRRFLPSR